MKILVKPSDFFNASYFRKYFMENMMAKKGGGRDGLTPKTFIKEYEKMFDSIARRCLNGTYHFSPYKEKLLLKGRNKYPRVLSIPSMRDRIPKSKEERISSSTIYC